MGRFPLPPFFVPIFAFIAWAFLIFYYFPILRLDLHLADQLIAPQLFISYLILIFAWALSGPLTAAILTALSALIVLYVCLGTKEASLFIQVFAYAGLFAFMAFFLYELQKKLNDRHIVKEKMLEDIHVSRENMAKKNEVKKALEGKVQRFLGLNRLSETLKSAQSVQEAAQQLTAETHRMLPRADVCVLYLVDESKHELSLVASSRRGNDAVREKRGSVFELWAVKRNSAIMIEDSWTDFRFSTDQRESSAHLRSVCASPLLSENKVLGVLRASSADASAFSSDDLRLLDVLASLGAVTLRNRLLFERMHELAVRDSLTGLYLNRYFQERLAEEIARAELGHGVFSLILLDVDHFKRYNDEYGHSAGDLVLKNIAGIFLNRLDEADVVARYGGEELIALLPGKSLAQAMGLAENIRSDIEKNKFLLRRVEGHVTSSFGVAAFPQDGHSKEQLVRSVDKYLYEAKKSGRNRVCGAT